MARPLRIDLPDAWYHVTSRGNAGELTFLDDDDRHRFLGLVSELPERFGLEVHAFVLMGNHYHLLVRRGRVGLSRAFHWLQGTYTARFNWAHRRYGHLFQGRFKAHLIRDEVRLDEVARYVHLNPVRIGGLGLSKEDQARERVVGCGSPSAEVIARRVDRLRSYRWSSWPFYAGLADAPDWLTVERLVRGCGGVELLEQRQALIRFTESPIRQGSIETPWGGMVAGVVLGEVGDAMELIRSSTGEREEVVTRRMWKWVRPDWEAVVAMAEDEMGIGWAEAVVKHGDWHRDAVLAVATRHLGWRVTEVADRIPGLTYGAAAQGVRRFWRLAKVQSDAARFAERLRQRAFRGLGRIEPPIEPVARSMADELSNVAG